MSISERNNYVSLSHAKFPRGWFGRRVDGSPWLIRLRWKCSLLLFIAYAMTTWMILIRRVDSVDISMPNEFMEPLIVRHGQNSNNNNQRWTSKWQIAQLMWVRNKCTNKLKWNGRRMIVMETIMAAAITFISADRNVHYETRRNSAVGLPHDLRAISHRNRTRIALFSVASFCSFTH